MADRFQNKHNLHSRRETSGAVRELFQTLNQQVQVNQASAAKLQESSDMVQRALRHLGRFDSLLLKSSKLFRRLERTNQLYKYLFYLALFIYLCTCGVVIARHLTPGFILNLF